MIQIYFAFDSPNKLDMMNNQLLRDSLGWGFILWFIGYVIGIIFFFVFPTSLIGWLILPIGLIVTLWVLLKKVKGDSLQYYLILAIVWTVIAVVFDYFFIVKALKPADGYYKLDVYLYYLLTFIIPLTIGWRKTKRSKAKSLFQLLSNASKNLAKGKIRK